MSLYLKGWHTVKRDGFSVTYHEGQALKLGRITCVVLAITSDQRRTWKRNCDKLGINANPVGCNCQATGIKAHAPSCPCGKGSERYDTDTGEHLGERPPATVAYSCQGTMESLDKLARTPYVKDVMFGEAAVPRGIAKPCPHSRKVKRTTRPIQERYVACQQSAMRDEVDIAKSKSVLSTIERCDVLLHQGRGAAIDTPVPAKPRGEYDKPKKAGKVSMSQYESLASAQAASVVNVVATVKTTKKLTFAVDGTAIVVAK